MKAFDPVFGSMIKSRGEMFTQTEDSVIGLRLFCNKCNIDWWNRNRFSIPSQNPNLTTSMICSRWNDDIYLYSYLVFSRAPEDVVLRPRHLPSVGQRVSDKKIIQSSSREYRLQERDVLNLGKMSTRISNSCKTSQAGCREVDINQINWNKRTEYVFLCYFVISLSQTWV